MATKISSKAELEDHFKAAGGKIVLVDFFATWCGPCRKIAPKLEQMAIEFSSRLVVVKVDVDEADQLAQFYGIDAMPTFIIFRNGKQIASMKGDDAAKLRAMIQKHI